MRLLGLLLVSTVSLVYGSYECTQEGGYCISKYSGSCPGGKTVESTGWFFTKSTLCSSGQTCCIGAVTTRRPTVKGETLPPAQPSDCGKTSKPPTNRIVGGGPAKKGAWPWQISLRYSGRHICGGAILNQDWIVTAAHCFLQSDNPSYYKVRIGTHDFGNLDDDTQDVSITKIVRHPNWKGVTGSVLGDVAMAKFKSPIDLSNKVVGSVCLAEKAKDAADTHSVNGDCWVTGWGYTSGYTQTIPNKLQEVNAPVLTNTRCNAWSYGWSGRVQSTQICFGTGEDSRGACRGDSGGPLVCKRNDTFHLIGVVSWGTPTCSGKPGVFSRITSYEDWIKDQLQYD